MRFDGARIQVRDVDAQTTFYCDVLGMSVHAAQQRFGATAGNRVGYAAEGASIELIGGATAPLAPKRLELFWKFGITVRNLDAAAAHMRSLNYAVSKPSQFRDIGYLCHLRDPEGFPIELLQHGFRGNEGPPPTGHPIGSQATLAHITLRINDLDSAQRFCEQDLGMRLMSVQPLPDFDFTLYFFAGRLNDGADEALPNPDLKAVANREWLWARPYPMLELQHLSARIVAPAGGSSAGFMALNFSTAEGKPNAISAETLGPHLLKV